MLKVKSKILHLKFKTGFYKTQFFTPTLPLTKGCLERSRKAQDGRKLISNNFISNSVNVI